MIISYKTSVQRIFRFLFPLLFICTSYVQKVSILLYYIEASCFLPFPKLPYVTLYPHMRHIITYFWSTHASNFFILYIQYHSCLFPSIFIPCWIGTNLLWLWLFLVFASGNCWRILAGGGEIWRFLHTIVFFHILAPKSMNPNFVQEKRSEIQTFSLNRYNYFIF